MLPTRKLGSQGLEVSALGLGLMGMSQSCGTAEERDDDESIATIHRAIELGCTFLDTAEVYGLYANEKLLARKPFIRSRRSRASTRYGSAISSRESYLCLDPRNEAPQVSRGECRRGGDSPHE